MSLFRNIRSLTPTIQTRTKGTYVAPGGRTVLKRRPSRKLRSEDVRPAIYYKFDQTVELSDGSTIQRRSVYPSVEWKMLQDQRNSSIWNPSKPDLKALLAGESGKLAKFRRKFGGLGETSAELAELAGATANSESAPAQQSAETDAFDLDSLMSEDAKHITTGRLHQANKVLKKKK